MKHLKLIFLLTMLFSVVYLHATPYSYNGINYILNDEDLTASVTSGSYYGSIVIPSIVNSKYTVTSIGKCAFIYNSNITSVTIPNSITTIEDDAFNGCSKLKSVNIPNSVTSIGLCAFYGCSELTEIFIPESVSHLDIAVFGECGSLETIQVDEKNEYFDSRNDCNAIIRTEDNTLMRGGSNTVIPNSVTAIDIYAFSGCSSLTSITIPNSVTSIGHGAFYKCSNLSSVTCLNETPPSIIGENPIPDRANYSLYVSAGSKAAYEAADYWKEFKEIVEINTINIGSTGFATYCSPYALDFSDIPGVKAYIASGFEPSTGTLVLTRALKVPAGEGLYLVGDAGTYNVPVSETDMVYSNLLKGVTTATTINPTDGSYTNFILSNGSNGIGFYTLSTAGELAAGKAYLQLPTSNISNVKTINLNFGIEGTAIQDIKSDNLSHRIYNLQGQPVSLPKSGVYIIDGKKVFIK